MIKNIKNFFAKFVVTLDYDLNRYIMSRYPKNVADVENFMFDFYLQQNRNVI